MIRQRPIWWLVATLLLMISCVSSFEPSTPTPENLNLPGVVQIEPPKGLLVTGLVWSPDSSRLAVSYYRISMGDLSLPTLFQIQILDIPNGKMKLIEESEQLSELQMSNVSAWLSDDRIAFYARDNAREGTWLISEEDSGSKLLLTEGVAAFLSPNGEQIAFWEPKQGSQLNSESIYIRSLANGAQEQVFNIEEKYTTEGILEWSPDEDRILFTFGDSRVSTDDMFKNIDIYIVDLTSKESIKLTNEGVHGSASWSPDGKLIAYTYQKETGDQLQDGLYVMRSDGSCPVQLFKSGDHDVYGVSWSPNGRWIAFAWNEGVYLLDTEKMQAIELLKNGMVCP